MTYVILSSVITSLGLQCFEQLGLDCYSFWLLKEYAYFLTLFPCYDGWMDDLQFYILFNSISVMSASGQWVGGDERLCAMEPHIRLKRSPPLAGLEFGTARFVGQCLSH